MPIVASKLPSLTEILNENNSFLVEPDNSASLAKGLDFILKNPEFGRRIAEQAFLDVQKYTWQKRANRVMNFVKTL